MVENCHVFVPSLSRQMIGWESCYGTGRQTALRCCFAPLEGIAGEFSVGREPSSVYLTRQDKKRQDKTMRLMPSRVISDARSLYAMLHRLYSNVLL